MSNDGNIQDDFQNSPAQEAPEPIGHPEDYAPPTDVDDSKLTAPVEDAPKQEPEAIELDAHTKAMARQMGIDIEDGDPEKIQQQVDQAEQMRLQQFMQMGGMQQPHQMGFPGQYPQQQWQNQWGPQQGYQQPSQQFQNFQQPPQGQQQPPGQQQQQPPQTAEKFEFKDLDSWDESAQETFGQIQQQFNKQQEFLTSQLDEMRQMFQGFVQTQEQKQAASTTAWIDKQLSDLGDDVFGNGSINQLGPYSPAAQARERFVSEYVAFCDMNGVDPHDCNADIFNRVLRINGMTTEASSNQKKLSDRLKQRSKQTIGRPATRRGKTAAEKQIHPEAGIPMGDVNTLQDDIDRMLASN